jgi:hypothetical protein
MKLKTGINKLNNCSYDITLIEYMLMISYMVTTDLYLTSERKYEK